MGIEGNKRTDSLAKFATRMRSRLINKIPFSDLIPLYHRVIRNAWRFQWASLTSTANCFKLICLDISDRFPWFFNIIISKIMYGFV